ncbi:MAG: AMP-binding protein, partial [Actinomycetota bacterium]|nr:AMP-binding protein [Actinomycetota bacterium]
HTPVKLPVVGGGLKPMFGNSFKVLDDAGAEVPKGEVGELAVKGPGVMRGYHGRDEATSEALTADGWLRTGDLARARPLGYVQLAGRKKDVIKVGGYSVFAVEVERALEEHPAVAEAAVLGLPDARKGEVVVAAVRLLPDATATPEDLVAFGKEKLSDYKVPRRIVVVDELPRTGTDKVQKRGLLPLFDGHDGGGAP